MFKAIDIWLGKIVHLQDIIPFFTFLALLDKVGAHTHVLPIELCAKYLT